MTTQPNPWRPATHVDSLGRVSRRRPAVDRFFARVAEDDNGCWLWAGAHHPLGYGHFRFNGRIVPAHRWCYEVMRAEIGDLHLDHLCRVPACVNPWHLEPVSPRINMLRGESPAAVTYRTGLCRRGHAMENAYWFNGRRACRTCFRETQRRYEARKASA